MSTTAEPNYIPLSSDKNTSEVITDDLYVAEILQNMKVSETTLPENFSIQIKPKELDKITLLFLVFRIINYHDLQKKYEIPIDAKYIECLQQITKKTPEFFWLFETALRTIIQDGVVSVGDIPELVKIMTTLYNTIHSIQSKTDIELCAGLLKLLFFISIKENLVPVNMENHTSILVAFDNLIDSVAELLKKHTQLSDSGSSCSTVTCNFSGWWFK